MPPAVAPALATVYSPIPRASCPLCPPAGVLICWDQWFPEGARCAALQGAEVGAGAVLASLPAPHGVLCGCSAPCPSVNSQGLVPPPACPPLCSAVSPNSPSGCSLFCLVEDPVLPHRHRQRAAQPGLLLLPALGAGDAGPCRGQHGEAKGLLLCLLCLGWCGWGGGGGAAAVYSPSLRRRASPCLPLVRADASGGQQSDRHRTL